MTLLGNEFHSEIVLGTKEEKEQKVGGSDYKQFYYGGVQEWEGRR